MAKPRIIIADSDVNYVIPMQAKFAEDFFEKADIEIITDPEYFRQLFSKPQRADIMILSEDLYDLTLQRHNIGHIFLMTEQAESDRTADPKVDTLFKYSSLKEIYNEITGRSADVLKMKEQKAQSTKVVLVCSASGGVGKTTVAMGISASLTKHYKQVLYISASRMHTFHHLLENRAPVSAPDIYTKLMSADEEIYANLKPVIRKEQFSYLPPFKAALMSLGLQYGVYEQIIRSARKSGEYDFIVVDADVAFDEDQAALIDLADKVVVVTDQTVTAVEATNVLVSNVNGMHGEKYIFLCNRFSKDEDNALQSPGIPLRFTVSDYIDRFAPMGNLKPEALSGERSIQRAAFLII